MANKYAGTQTEKNLQAAFAGESQAKSYCRIDEEGPEEFKCSMLLRGVPNLQTQAGLDVLDLPCDPFERFIFRKELIGKRYALFL